MAQSVDGPPPLRAGGDVGHRGGGQVQKTGSSLYCRVQAREISNECAGLRLQRSDLQRRFDYYPQSAQRSGVELVQVVAGNVLHHLAAGLGLDAVGAQHADADKPVSRRAVGVGQGPGSRRWTEYRRRSPVLGRALPAARTCPPMPVLPEGRSR